MAAARQGAFGASCCPARSARSITGPKKAVFTKSSLWRDLTPLDYLLTRFSENACFQTDAWLVSRELTGAAGSWTDFGSPDDDGECFLQGGDQQHGREIRSRRAGYLPDRQPGRSGEHAVGQAVNARCSPRNASVSNT